MAAFRTDSSNRRTRATTMPPRSGAPSGVPSVRSFRKTSRGRAKTVTVPVLGHDVGRARGIVHEGHLADDLARAEEGESLLADARDPHGDAQPAFGDDVGLLSRVARREEPAARRRSAARSGRGRGGSSGRGRRRRRGRGRAADRPGSSRAGPAAGDAGLGFQPGSGTMSSKNRTSEAFTSRSAVVTLASASRRNAAPRGDGSKRCCAGLGPREDVHAGARPEGRSDRDRRPR